VFIPGVMPGPKGEKGDRGEAGPPGQILTSDGKNDWKGDKGKYNYLFYNKCVSKTNL